MAHIVLLS